MSTEKATAECLEWFHTQEREFKKWIGDYFRTAFYLHWLRDQVTEANWEAWLKAHFRPDQIAVVNDMLWKLEHTDTGRTILESCEHPDQFSFPE